MKRQHGLKALLWTFIVVGTIGGSNGSDIELDGIGVFPLEEQTWRSKVMSYPAAVEDRDRIWSGEEFFASEYGESCRFSTGDFLKRFGYHGGGDYRIDSGHMVFTVGRRPFYFGFGSVDDDRSRPSNRFGASWGPNLKDRYRLHIELEQDRPTQWHFTLESAKRGRRRPIKSFRIPGTGRIEFETDLGFVRGLWQRQRIVGIRFTCATPVPTSSTTSLTRSSCGIEANRTLLR